MNDFKKKILATALSIPLTLGMVAGCDNRNNESVRRHAQSQQIQELREIVLSYLISPRFSNEDFFKQITGTNADFELYDARDNRVYISIPEESLSKSVLTKLTKNPNIIEFAKTDDGKFLGSELHIKDMTYRNPGHYLISFPATDLKINPNTKIRKQLGSIVYDISLKELSDYLTNKSIYRGYLDAITGETESGYIVMSNHGAFVAKKGEPSLTRLVYKIVREEDPKEVKAQKLLDFVTENIDYFDSEAYSSREILKRPNEVLLSGGSDCSGLTILYSSLLEQVNINHLLVYFDDHISVAVEGDFPDYNDLSFTIGNRNYSMAETTSKGFKIGMSPSYIYT